MELMAVFREWVRRLGGTFGKNQRDHELEEELRLHLELAGRTSSFSGGVPRGEAPRSDY
jgi:hypothetical protein